MCWSNIVALSRLWATGHGGQDGSALADQRSGEIDVRTLVMMHASKDTRPERRCIADFRLKPGPVVRHPKQKGGVYQRGWYSHIRRSACCPARRSGL
jgi:hypothetical protein